MKAHSMIQGAVLSIALATTAACSGTSPVTTNNVTEPSAPQADRQVLSTDVKADPQMESLIKQLPQRISEADAKQMLITIDPDKVQDGNTYSVQARGGHGFRGHSFRGHGFRGSRFFGGLGFFGLGSTYFPYYLNAGYYYPYFNSGYYPYLTGYGGLYNSSYYYNPFFSYSNPYLTSYAFRGAYRWPGIRWY
jgi:hypothetical protein